MKHRLALRSETLRRLDDDALDAIKGGAGDGNASAGDGQGKRYSSFVAFCCGGGLPDPGAKR